MPSDLEPAYLCLEQQRALAHHQEGQEQLQYLVKVLSPLSPSLEPQGLRLDNPAAVSPPLEYQRHLDQPQEGQRERGHRV